MKLSDHVIISPNILAREIGAETVILDVESGRYLGLDPVGTRVWQLLTVGKSLAEICDTMLDEYDVNRTALESDTLKLVEHLIENRLVKCVDTSSSC